MNIDHYLSAAMDERYGKLFKINDYSELLHHMVSFVNNKELFKSLFYIEEGSRINIDPSRPKLE